MGAVHHRPRRLAEVHGSRRRLIGLTPLIDVVFILLVFFMLASNLQRLQSMTLEAPAEASGSGDAETVILVDVYFDDVAIDGAHMALDAAADLVARRAGGTQAPAVLIRPAPGVLLQRTVTVLEILKDAGASSVSFLNAEAT